MPKINNIELKDATTNYERKILGIIQEQMKDMNFGRINLEVVVHNSKIVLVELQTTKKSYKID